ncbi:DUF2625 domain-containing protein [Flavobacterium poyangense]|uniref:DUF2625 domain-containing protein n=1 Tax=Flavobacterium poyangense TaxID=2204302 RepID=UPI001FB98749|nr:DUF2625 domain-containing protein [Flavobacterium sp. JXAS1]
MTRNFFAVIAMSITFITTAQTKMQSVDKLINKTDPGWKLVESWIKTATNKVEILPVDAAKAKDVLYKTQVTTQSPMGGIVFMTGGLLIDDGWIRILGSGNAKFNRTLPDWNKGKSFKEFGETPSFLIVADDAIGGFYLLNGGGLGTDLGKMYYFSPDNLEYEPLDITYSEFLQFCFYNDLDKFYDGNRWKGWREEVSKLKGDEVFNFYPFLWSKEGSDINKNSRKVIPVEEQYSLNVDLHKQLGANQ